MSSVNLENDGIAKFLIAKGKEDGTKPHPRGQAGCGFAAN
jgi:hypothetical protein